VGIKSSQTITAHGNGLSITCVLGRHSNHTLRFAHVATIRGYFVSEEAEQAAKWKMVEELRTKKEHLVVLKSELKNLAETWTEFARAIQSPDLHLFAVDPQKITVGKWGEKLTRPVAEIRDSNVQWDSLAKLVADYQKTADDTKRLQSELNLP
jgi:uncharacterized protein YlxW (UPF0749 family)